MSACLWCDAPTDGTDRLCSECRAVHDGPVFRCTVHPLPTLGASCAECDAGAERLQRAVAANSGVALQLRRIRRDLIDEWSRPWFGAEHGKAILGQALNCALAELEGAPPPAPLRVPGADRRIRARSSKSVPEPTPKLNRRAVEARAERLFIGVDAPGESIR